MESKAIRSSRRESGVEGVIPKEQRVLLEVNTDRYGIHQQMEKLLRELNDPKHRLVTGFRKPALPGHERLLVLQPPRAGGRCSWSLLWALQSKSPSSPLRPPCVKVGIRNWLYYLHKVVSTSAQHLGRNVAPTGQALRGLGEILHDAPTCAVASTPGLRRLTEAVLAAGEPGKPLLKPMVELLSTALEQCYKDWLSREDPVVWFRKRRFTSTSSKDPLPEAVTSISHESPEILAGGSGGSTCPQRLPGESALGNCLLSQVMHKSRADIWKLLRL